MEKETAYSNLVGSGDELLLVASMGVQEDCPEFLVQSVKA